MSNRPMILVGLLAIVVLLPAGVLVLAQRDGASDDAPRSMLGLAVASAPIEVGVNPVSVAVGAGAVWVVDATRGTLSKVDPRTQLVVGRPRRVGGGPFAVAVGAGAVWVAAGDGAVRAFNPRTLRQTGPPAVIPGANGLAVGAGGVWVTARRTGTVVRVDPQTRRPGRPIRVGRGPA
ncbi:MAG: PQQ-binding-like beta-propeller repeat protein, partial [Actinomycetota bacterium]|nr:PQQ-binding-like beta-propeller repeat protein [Actinomycetota bacterium]